MSTSTTTDENTSKTTPPSPGGDGDKQEVPATATTVSPPSGDRYDEILQALNDPTLDTLPDHLRMKYTDGFTPENLEEQLQSHPFFMTELPDPSKPLPPLLEAFQQLKYSEVENTQHELAINHKEDGMFHFKIKKYRIASMCFTTALSHEFKSEEDIDKELIAQLFNNRSASMWYLGNYRSCVKDCEEAVKFKKGYLKAFKRAVLACEVLGRWEEVDKWCSTGETEFEEDSLALKFFHEKRLVARRGKASVLAQERKRSANEKQKETENIKILEMIKERGVKLRTESFLESGVAVDEGKVVTITEENTLAWPVLFLYPQYNQSDFIEQFDERDTFKTHLHEMFDDNQPGWDVDGEFKSGNVNVLYLSEDSRLIPIPQDWTLLQALKLEMCWVPTTGVPSFFVLANNEFSNDFKERIGG